MPITELHHVSLVVADTRKALEFYIQVLGLAQCERPDLKFPGAFLCVGSQQIHLLEVTNVDPVAGRPDHVGRDRHVAFYVDDLTDYEQRLAQNQIPITKSKSGRQAIFCRDYDGNGIELIQTETKEK